MDACLISRERQKESGSRWEGQTRGGRGRGNCIQNIAYENIILNFKKDEKKKSKIRTES